MLFLTEPGPFTMIKMWREAIPGVVQKVLSPGNTGYHQSRNRPKFSPFEYYPGLKHTLIGLIGLIPRHGAGKLTATLVVTSASLLALSTAPANATPSDGPIRNAAYSQCIDAPGGALNVRLKLVACSSSGTQQWEFIPTGAANTYVIRNRASGLCMEVNNGTSTPKETVDEFTCNDWRLSSGCRKGSP